MRIVTLKTYQAIQAGHTKKCQFFSLEHNVEGHKGLVLKAAEHPILGAGVMIETEGHKKTGKVSFCPINNVEEIVFASEADEPSEPVKRGPGRPKAVE